MKKLLPLLLCLACGSGTDTVHDRVIYVRHDGADLMTWVRGNVASDVMIVMMHGGPGGESTTYTFDFGKLEERYGIVYYDQRASGSSRGGGFGKDKLSYEQFGDDLNAVISVIESEYAPETLVLMGHSFGVEVGTEWVVRPGNQDRIDGWIPVDGTHSVIAHVEALCDHINRGLTLFEDNPDEWLMDEDSMELYREASSDCETYDLTLPLAPNVLYDPWDVALSMPDLRLSEEDDFHTDDFFEGGFIGPQPPLWLDPYSPKAINTNDPIVYPPLMDAYLSFDRTAELGNVTLPTHILWGEWDAVLPVSNGERYLAALGGAAEDQKLIRFRRSGHSPMVEQPQYFTDAVIDFVDSLSP